MERIDKVIASQTEYSRNDVKKLVKSKKVIVNGKVVNKSDIKIDIDKDKIFIDGNLIEIKKYVYLVLNKPKGYVSATRDEKEATVLDLISQKYRRRDVFPVGRLDKDTTGLMILTDDGTFAHEVLAPKKHVKKVYRVVIDKEITEDMIKGFKEGVRLNDGICKSSLLEKEEDNSGLVTLTEGRYHQIKRMFGCYGAKVLELKRIKMGNFELPGDLKEGEYRELGEEELNLIQTWK